jgi:hypothetical protein
MKRLIILAVIFLMLPLAFAPTEANAQGRERFTGTVVYFGSGRNTRTVTTNFTLDITGMTTNEQVQNYLSILKDKGQEQVLNAMDDNELGRFSVSSSVGIPINFVRERETNGHRHIFIAFRRWTQFAELRYGYRSLDYPFGVIELMIDPRTGKGEGTYIAAARVRWDSDGDNGEPRVEIENFATYPARLMGVQSDRRRP